MQRSVVDGPDRARTLSPRKDPTSSRPGLERRGVGHRPHEAAADDHAVGDPAHLRDLLRRADPEADRDGDVGRRADPLDHLAQLRAAAPRARR